MFRRTVQFLLGLGIVATTAAAQNELDVPWIGYDASIYPQGHLPWAARSADFDADGDLDLAVATWYANSRLCILMNEGDGSFAPPVMHALALGALDLEVGDFDGDEDVDIVVSGTGQSFEGQWFVLFRNLGTGAFVPAGQFSAGTGPTGITAADFDLDGDLDVAVAHDRYIEFGNSMAWMLNQGDGSFGPPTVLQIGQGTHKITSGDLNGDLYPDLVIAYETNGFSVMLNNGGNGFFAAVFHESLETGWFRTSPNARLADVEPDGDLDVLYSHADLGFPAGRGMISLHRNHGNGTFAPPQEITLLFGGNGATDIEFTDVTGDGVPDVVAATEISQKWVVVPGLGGGSFGPARGYRAGEDPIAVEVGDLDGDADRDVAVIGRNSLEACIYRNPGDGEFEQPPVIEMIPPNSAPASYSNLAAGDIDGDGDVDLAVGQSANFDGHYGISVRRNQGDGTLGDVEAYSAPSFPIHVKLRDLNGDGFDDLLWIDDAFNARFRYRLNQGNGTFGGALQGPAASCLPEVVDAGDVDGDGDLDVLLGCYFDVLVSRNNGGTFGAYQSHSIGGGAGALALADFDHDGALDLATNSGTQGYVEVSLGRGDGTFEAPVVVQTGRAVTAITIGDVDGDTHADIAVSYGLDGNGLSVARGRGDGSFHPALSYHGAYSAYYDNVRSIALGDLDEDGDLDALAAYYGAQEICFWRGHGDGTFDQVVRYGVGHPGWDLALGDFDGDTVEDVAVLVEGYAPNGWYYPGIVLLAGNGNGAGCVPPTTYCVGAPNSAGAGARIGWSGMPSVSANQFTLTAAGAVPNRFGLFYYGPTQIQTRFGDGFRCVGGGIFRLHPAQLADAVGSYERWVDFESPPASSGAGAIQPGSTWNFQCWYRDPGFGGSGFNLSDALSVTFCP